MATLDKYTWVRGDLIPQEKAVQPAVQDDDDMTSYERELGIIFTKMEAMEASVASLHADLREVRDFMRDAKSGWKVLTVAGGIGGAIAAAGVKFLPLLIALPK
jgi:hypothetical protein